MAEIRQFNRHEVMDVDTLKEIGGIINDLLRLDANFQFLNYFYGLYDGFDYSGKIIAHKTLINNIRLMDADLFKRISLLCVKVSEYPTGVTQVF